MGTGQSIPDKLSRQKAYELTRNTRDIMDDLLKYMLERIGVRDFLALSNPTECNKYVIFLANNLSKHFYELKISPYKDKKDVIAFRPIKDFTDKPKDTREAKDAENDKRNACLTLAYFYTRIFQIYGALALTVIDDINLGVRTGISSIVTRDTIQRGLITPGYRETRGGVGGVGRGEKGEKGGGGGKEIIGGAKPGVKELNNFLFLTSLFETNALETESYEGYEIEYRGGDEGDEVRFKPNQPEGTKQKGIFYIAIKEAPTNEYNKLYISTSLKDDTHGSDRLCTIESLSYYKKNKSYVSVKGSDIISKKTIIVRDTGRPISRQAKLFKIVNQDGSDADNSSIQEYFNEVFSNAINYIRTNRVTDTVTTSSSNITVSEAGTIEELKLSKIIHNLKNTKPLGHCLARALQLLQTSPGHAISSVCKAKFIEYDSDKTSRSGIPKPGDSLNTSPGLAALSQLFYDSIDGTSIVIDDKPGPYSKISSKDSYIDFMKKIAFLFQGDDLSDKNPNSIVKDGLGAIKNKRIVDECKDSKDKDIEVPVNRVASVQNIVNQLLHTQVKHVAECGKIIRLLFRIDYSKQSNKFTIVSLSDNIITKGLPEIQRINLIARNLLVNYYTNCELTYLKGMKMVVKPVVTAPSATTPATPTAATAASTPIVPIAATDATTIIPTKQQLPILKLPTQINKTRRNTQGMTTRAMTQRNLLRQQNAR